MPQNSYIWTKYFLMNIDLIPSRLFFRSSLMTFALISLLLMGCGGIKSSNSNSTSENELRVMAYNIHHAQPMGEDHIDLEAIAQVIRDADPDLVALQEVDADTQRSGAGNQAAMLAEKLDMHYFFAKAIDYGGGEYGQAVLSKHPILEEEAIFLPHVTPGSEQRVLAFIRVQLPWGKELHFGSVHLDHRGDPKDRLSQLEEVIKATSKDDLPVILAGDFNALEGSATMEMVYKYFEPTCTDCSPTFPANDPDKTIDFVVYKDPLNLLRLLNNKVIDEPKASDHRPVMAVFQEK